MKIKTKIYAFICFTACFTAGVEAQNVVSSPYSSFGIGNMGTVRNPTILGMGGVSYALKRNNVVNMFNPTSLSGLDSCSFVFDIGIYAERNVLSTSQQRSPSFNGNLGYLSFAFPIAKWWATGVGLQPMSDVSYKIREEGNLTRLPFAHYNLYEGSGGINKLSWNHAFIPVKDLSFGISLEYLFGNYYRSSSIHFTDTAHFFNSASESNVRVDAVNLKLGAQYFRPIKDKYTFGVGFVYGYPMRLPTEEVSYRYTFIEQGKVVSLRDSVTRTEIKDKYIQLPTHLGIGISLEETNHWFVGIDATYNRWSKFEFQSKPVSEMKDNFKIASGGEIKPNAYGNYLSKIAYRFGMFYDSGYLQLHGQSITEKGFSCGIGLPIRKSQSLLNISFTYSLRGTHAQGLLQEDVFSIGLSLSSKDRWFVKRKYQ